MVRRIFLALLLSGFLIALVPPFLTHGACTAEFDAVTDAFQALRPQFADLDRAQSYLSAQALPYQLLSAQRCLIWPEREDVSCPGGPVLLAYVPVKDRVCHYYRDRRIRLQLGFNSAQQLVRIQTNMNPYQMLKLPALGVEIDWAR
jgi:hypothetical protein